MPRVNIYIRNDDIEHWEAIEDKPLFIHDSILSHTLAASTSVYSTTDGIKEDIQKINEGKNIELCKHGYPKNGWSCKKGCV